jgi:serine/threonine protein kinase
MNDNGGVSDEYAARSLGGGQPRSSVADIKVAIKVRVGAEPTSRRESAPLATSAVADEALLLEAMLLNGLQHPGILRIVGVVTETAPVLLCTELMLNGDLRKYLRACRPNKVDRIATVTTTDMVVMASVLASAMAFLERQSIIHRDVAARNILVGATTTDVKVADLGAARNVHRTNTTNSQGVYTATTDHNPARWMPLEALRDAKFSHKSDVFAFGVLLWEILSLGQTPWGAFGVKDFVDALKRGERLQFPPAIEHDPVATIIYTIALRCWSYEPRKRPLFSLLDGELAVHRTVATVSTTLQRPNLSDTPAHRSRLTQPSLDDDGYVEEPELMGGYEYADELTEVPITLSVDRTSLDEEGYVQEQPQTSSLVENDYAGGSILEVAFPGMERQHTAVRDTRGGVGGGGGPLRKSDAKGTVDTTA